MKKRQAKSSEREDQDKALRRAQEDFRLLYDHSHFTYPPPTLASELKPNPT